ARGRGSGLLEGAAVGAWSARSLHDALPILTRGWVVKVEPAVAPAGLVVTASRLAAAGVTVKEPLLVVVRAPSAKWRLLAPLESMERKSTGLKSAHAAI